MVYRSDLDHPNSLHNETTKQTQKMEVQFPQTVNSAKKPVYGLNGFYDQNPASLKGAFVPHKNQYLAPVD